MNQYEVYRDYDDDLLIYHPKTDTYAWLHYNTRPDPEPVQKLKDPLTYHLRFKVGMSNRIRQLTQSKPPLLTGTLEQCHKHCKKIMEYL